MIHSRLIDKAYSILVQSIFGEKAVLRPPWYLYIIWILLALTWIKPMLSSLWEDEIWMLEVIVNQPWTTTLGFVNPYSGAHTLYAVLAKIFIKSTGHHYVEFFYRLPSFVAGLLLFPISFAVFDKKAGKIGGIALSIVIGCMPMMVYHASNARGYMLWLLFTTIALGLTKGFSERNHWIRLAIIYFLLGISHSVAWITLGCFAAGGSIICGTRPKIMDIFINCCIVLPSIVFNYLMIREIFRYNNELTTMVKLTIAQSVAFIPGLFESFFGSALFPGWGILWFVLILFGLVLIISKSPWYGAAVTFFSFAMIFVLVLTRNPFNFSRVFTMAVPFWLLAAFECVKFLSALIIKSEKMRNESRSGCVIACFFVVASIPWVPSYLRNVNCPKQDYAGLYNYYTTSYRSSKTLYGISSRYATGMGYYARQYGISYKRLSSVKEIEDSVLSYPAPRGIAIISETETDSLLLAFVRSRMNCVARFEGLELPTVLYMPVKVNHTLLESN